MRVTIDTKLRLMRRILPRSGGGCNQFRESI